MSQADEVSPYDTKAEYSDERIASHDAIGARVVAAENIQIVDLNEAVQGHTEFRSDNVHFNGQGSQIVAARIDTTITKLPPP